MNPFGFAANLDMPKFDPCILYGDPGQPLIGIQKPFLNKMKLNSAQSDGSYHPPPTFVTGQSHSSNESPPDHKRRKLKPHESP